MDHWDWLLTFEKVQISLPRQQLTHFLYIGDSVASHLPLCPNLVYLRFEFNENKPDPDPWSQLPNAPCLESLEGLCISFPNAFHHPIEFFEKYEVPNLKSLRLETGYLSHDPEIWSYLRANMSRCTHLTRLSLRCDHMNPHGIRGLFGCASNIHILDVELLNFFDLQDNDADWNVFFQTLEWIDHDPEHRFLPQLHTLILRPTGMIHEDDTCTPKPITTNPCFLAMILSRMARPLDQRIRKIVAYPFEPLDRQLIQEYIDDGLVYEEYPASRKSGPLGAWIDDDPALYDWHELHAS
ncbi:hypothetical protein H1R20_g15104, partial [Candolleomyces eurysporus]